jgi:two-component system, LytTR family, sensor kinase
MKTWIKPNRLEWMSFLVIMPFICFVVNNLLFNSREFYDYRVWAFSFPVLYAFGIVSWYLQVFAMHWLRWRFPRIEQTTIRLAILGLSHFTIISLTYISIFVFYDVTNFLGYELDPDKLRFALFFGIALTMIGTTMWESEYTLEKLRTSLIEKEQLEQLTIQHEFEELKSQVNPHFLFNCFNTLSSLISEDQKQAENFLNELSKVYRYLLRNNENGLSTLQTEIKFIESYYRLLRTRHGESVELHIEIDKKYEQYLLPSLSLQLLVENAVKHNVLSKSKCLVIDIFTTSGNKLVVSNNLQLRTVKAPSNKIGLDNIRGKYELLDQSGFHVLEDSNSFSVVLPLIWNKNAGQIFINE